MQRFDLAVIGGGASGLMAAVTAAQCAPNLRIAVFESAPRVGKKLLATGNGKCNITNLNADPSHYHGDASAIAPLLAQYPPKAVLAQFARLGLLCRSDEAGRVYPYSRQAASVLDVLRFAADRLNVQTVCDATVTQIAKTTSGFMLQTAPGNKAAARAVILATGGKASPQLSGAQNGYALAQSLGHHVTPLYAALTIVKTPPQTVKALKGMRALASCTLSISGQADRHQTGEVQFTEQGLSGVCIFQFSRHVAQAVDQGRTVHISLDFMPEHTHAAVTDLVQTAVSLFPQQPALELLQGLLNKRVGQAVMRTALPQAVSKPAQQLSKAELAAVTKTIKQLRFPCLGTAAFSQAQITAGGVSLSGLTPMLSSRMHPGLYFTGELLNIDGDCGGFNLHWAWVSGIVAGTSAAHILTQQENKP